MKYRNHLVMIINSMMIIASITLAIAFGILGYSRPDGLQDVSLYDFSAYIYPAGKMWLSGLNPYDVFLFPYPPNSALFCMLLSITDLENSKILFLILNVCCVIVFVYLCVKLFRHSNIKRQFFLLDPTSSILISMLIGNVFIFNVLWVGQTSILITAALLASYYFYMRSDEVRSGIFLALALIKPQLAFTFFVWLLLEKKWKTLASSAVATVVLGIVPIYNHGIIKTIHDWISILNKYIQNVNSECFWNLFGLQPLLKDFGIHINSPIIFICSILSVILIHRFYHNKDILELYGILTIIGLLLGQASQYDLIIITPLLTYFLLKIPIKDFIKIFLFLFTFIIMNYPRQRLLLSDIRILHHHRVIVLVIVLLSLLLAKEGKQMNSDILATPNEA